MPESRRFGEADLPRFDGQSGDPGVPELRQRWQTANDRAPMDAFTFLLDPQEFRTVPTDWIPRLIPAHDWDTIASGVAQRLKAINQFLKDLYCG